ncbi:hypothetical protein GCM10010121_092490 [Streptomyces brasiliensis]|uniref:Uncharacterized protein n=1 Tax=Streptomyces brasiliensis TaxID=1954 RepID=A0A917UM62_9ACTN|nr:hypothetical protein GCM10010121_092490 [Streptomyces brasiliensis]
MGSEDRGGRVPGEDVQAFAEDEREGVGGLVEQASHGGPHPLGGPAARRPYVAPAGEFAEVSLPIVIEAQGAGQGDAPYRPRLTRSADRCLRWKAEHIGAEHLGTSARAAANNPRRDGLPCGLSLI